MNPYVVASENPQDLPILVIDKTGVIGSALVEKLCQEFLTIFVHGSERSSGNNTIYVPYAHKLPAIPDDLFSYIFTISETEKEALSSVKILAKKAKQINTPLIAIIPSTIASDKFLTKLRKLYSFLTILIYGDIFGSGETLSVADEYLYDATHLGKVVISRSGSEISYPILLLDVVAGILRVVFSQKHQGETFLLMPTFFISDVSLIRMIQKELSELHVLTKSRPRKQNFYHLPSLAIPVYPAYEIEERIKYALVHAPTRQIATRIRSYAPSGLARVKTNIKTTLSVVAASIVLLGILASAGIFIARHVTPTSNFSSVTSSQKGVWLKAVSLRLLHQVVTDFTPLANMLGLSRQADLLTEQLSRLTMLASEKVLLQEVLASQGLLSEARIRMLPVQLKKLYTTLALLQASGNLPQQIRTNPIIEQLIALGLPQVDLLPSLIGVHGKKTYLVLLQDNMQLRGGGGLITSYGLLTLEPGKPSRIVVHPIRDLDAQMQEEIATPEFVRRILGKSQLRLGDSNYSVDFPQAMKEVNLLYYLENKQRVDGIISVDTSFWGELLGLTGEINLPNAHQSIQKDNFFQLTQAYRNEISYTSQTNDFLAICPLLWEKLIEKGRSHPELVTLFLSNMVKQRHLQFYSEDPSVENSFLVGNLSATIIEKRAQQEGAYNDFISLNETNTGQNAANYYLKRSYEQKITISETGEAEVMLSLNYTNTSGQKSQFGGDYKAYAQLIVPQNAKLVSVFVGGEKQTIVSPGAKTFTPVKRNVKQAPSLEVVQVTLGERAVFGFPLTVAAGTTQNISLTYTLSRVTSLSNNQFTYRYLFAKQPGVLSDQLRVVFDFPSSMKVVVLPKGATELDGQVLFSTDLTTDAQAEIVLGKK